MMGSFARSPREPLAIDGLGAKPAAKSAAPPAESLLATGKLALSFSARRGAMFVFSIRVVSAALLFVSQIILARWIGATGYGLYVALWSVVLVAGGLSHLGLGVAMMRLVPEYRASNKFDLMRGLLAGGRAVAVAGGSIVALSGAAMLWLTGSFGDTEMTWALVLALLCLPAYALTEAQDALGRGQRWTVESLAPPYILRPALMLAGAATCFALGFPATAVTAMACALAATWLTVIAQTVLVQRRVSETVPAGPSEFQFKSWMKVSLPLLAVSGAELALQNADVLLLNALRSPEEVGVYYAAAKTTCLALFVHYAVGSAYAGQFATAGALGDKAALRALTREAVAWTFWPSVAVTVAVLAAGPYLLALFGDDFPSAYPAMWILSLGLLARAATGPSEFVLSMLGRQNECAKAFAVAALVSVGLNLLLIPFFGALGAATATACAFATASALNWRTARRELGLNLFVFAGRGSDTDILPFTAPDSSASAGIENLTGTDAALGTASELQPPVSFAVIRNQADLFALREDWMRLYEGIDGPTKPFLSFEWNAAWQKHYCDQDASGGQDLELAVVTGRSNGRLVLIWPLVLKRVAGLTYLSWMGAPVSQYGDVLVEATDAGQEALRCSWDELRARLKPDVICLRKVPQEAAVTALLMEKGARIAHTESAPFVDLKGMTAEALEMRYPAKARRNRRRLMRRLEEKGTAEFVHLTSGPEAVALAHQAIAFKRAWLEHRVLISPALIDARCERFFEEVSSGSGLPSCCVVSALKLDGQACAILVSVVGGSRLAGHIFAYDLKHEKAGAGVLLMEECVRFAALRGFKAFDLLAPADCYKYDWCDGEAAVHDWEIASSLRGFVLTRSQLSHVQDHAKWLMKRMPAPLRRVILKPFRGRKASLCEGTVPAASPPVRRAPASDP